ncbi:MAG: EAL domain-containing protein [Halomonadaceae bacterium]|nr:MAG: EAL domain-containing protein [Halomonadaceae bacterium]
MTGVNDKQRDVAGSMDACTELRARLSELSRGLGMLLVVVSGLSLIIRALGPADVDIFLPSFSGALAILLCGWALSIPLESVSRIRSGLRHGLSVLALFLALGTFVLYLFTGFPRDPVPQQWLLAPTTAFVVALLSAAAMALQFRSGVVLAQILGLAGLMLCLLALFGYAEGAIVLADLGTAFPMSIPAALLLILLTLSLLLASPGQGPMKIFTSQTIAGQFARRLLVPLMLLPVAYNFLLHNVARLGWYAPSLENALYVLGVMLAIGALVWWQVVTLYHSQTWRQRLLTKTEQMEWHHSMLVQAVEDYAIYSLDPEGYVSSWNKGAERLRGFSEEEILGQPYSRLFTPEDVAADYPQKVLETARQTGRMVDVGWQMRSDGSRFLAHNTLTRVDDSKGRILGFLKITRDMTAQHQAEEEHGKLVSILDTTVDPILVIDQQGFIETFNPAAEQAFGYPQDEILGQSVSQLLPAEGRKEHQQYLSSQQQTGLAAMAGSCREMMMLTREGLAFPVELTVSEMELQGEQKFTCIARDISSRKKAEKQLRRSEKMLNLALEAGNLGVWDIHPRSQKVIVTGPLFKAFPMARNRLNPLAHWLELLHPDDRIESRKQLDDISQGQRRMLSIEHRFRTRDGQWRWLYSRGIVSRRDEKGRGTRLHGATVDIHKRKSTEEALRKSKLDMEIALEWASFHLWHLEVKERRLLDLNSLTEALGYSPSSETRKLSFWQSLLHPDDLTYWQGRDLLPLPHELKNKGVELRLRTRDGHWRWMIAHAHVSERDEQGQPVLIAGTCVDITERKKDSERLLHAAQHDSLTGLSNRALVFQLGERLLAFATRHKQKCAVLFVDLDRFKPINDNFGHEAGDVALREVARRIRHCVRDEDVVGRLGGDEFLVILAEVRHAEGVTRVAHDIQDAINRAILFQDTKLEISSSIGISLYPTDGRNMETLVKNADAAMYHAKESGPNQMRFFTPSLNVRAKSLLQLETRMRQAIEDQTFTLYYQPFIDTERHQVVGVEALLRWPGENLSPNVFIPLAESTGLIQPLGDWVLTEAFKQQARWAQTAMGDLKMSVNVSPFQFRLKHFGQRVERLMQTTGVAPEQIQLEITEKVFIYDMHQVQRTLSKLRNTGLGIALDDFGKGYSSLNYLKQLPLNVLKIDKDFVREVQTDKASLDIIEAIINLGSNLGLQVIAEGIENEAVLELLRYRRCRHMQGFYLSHPMPADVFERWYRSPLTPGVDYRH